MHVEHDCPRSYWDLELCTECFSFTGPVRAACTTEAKYRLLPTTDGGRVVQVNGTGDLPLYLKHCVCEVARGDDAPLPGPTTWRTESGLGFELCWACALTPMDQSTRFAFSVCDHCRPVLKYANEFAGRNVFPVARHSIVNASAASRIPAADLTRDPELLVAEARLMFRGIDGMCAWQSTATRLNLEEAGLFDGSGPVRVPVPEYFATCKREGLSSDTRVVQLVRSAKLLA